MSDASIPAELPADLHPAIVEKLSLFEYSHLRPPLGTISARFHGIAHALVTIDELSGPELTIALTKLLEAKDAAVRAKVVLMRREQAGL